MVLLYMIAIIVVLTIPKKWRNIGRALNIKKIEKRRTDERNFAIGCSSDAILLATFCAGDWEPCQHYGCLSMPDHKEKCMSRTDHAIWYVDHNKTFHPDFFMQEKYREKLNELAKKRKENKKRIEDRVKEATRVFEEYELKRKLEG